MRDGDQLVFILFQCLLYLWKLGSVSNGGFQLSSLDTVCFETIAK